MIASCNHPLKRESMQKYILHFALIAIMGSCTNSNVEEVILTDDVIKSATALEYDTVFHEDIFPAVKKFYHYNDSIMIVLNKKWENHHFIEFYNTNTNSVVRQLFMSGKGPGEMLSVDMHINGLKMFVKDYSRQQLAEVDVDSLLDDDTYKPYIDKSINFIIASFAKYKGDYVFENSYSFIDENAGIIQDEKRLITPSEMSNIYDTKHDYNTINVSSNGHIIVNEDKERIIYANLYQSKIEVFDKDLNPVKRVKGPVMLDTKYYLTDDDPREVTFHKKIPFAYLEYCASKDYLFLNYIGDFMEGNTLYDKKSYVMQFDWEGNLIKCYKSDKYIDVISCSQDTKSINDVYATMLDNEGKYFLVRLHEKE